MLSVFISLHLLVVKFFKVRALYNRGSYSIYCVPHGYVKRLGVFHIGNRFNAIVHGADAEETAQRILMGLRDQVHQHYSSFSEDAGYVLARHRHLFTSRTLEQQLSMSYDYVNCWLRSVDEARAQLTSHVETQQEAATRFFGAPAGYLASNNDSLSFDSDYVASSEVDTDTASLVTHSTQDTTCTYASEVASLCDECSWAPSCMIVPSLGSIHIHLAEDDAAPSLGTLNDGSLASLSDDDLGSVGYLDSQQSKCYEESV
jgi:hypothetical protein